MVTKNRSQSFLVVGRDKAEGELKSQISKGKRLSRRSLRSQAEVSQAAKDFDKWAHYTIEMLRRFFDKQSVANKFQSESYENISADMHWRELGNCLITGAGAGVFYLENLKDSLHLYEAPSFKQDQVTQDSSNTRPEVFVVHGHDHATKEMVARYLETKLGLKVIILHEQANLNRTIIEKLEKHSEVQFAVVILTPDDMGCPKDKAQLVRPRARQNVIFELGFFIGRLGREKVCALYTGDVELPSDYQGILYISLDHNEWRTDLAKEIKAAGVRLDLSNAY